MTIHRAIAEQGDIGGNIRSANITAQIEMKIAGRRKQVRHGGTLCSKCLINSPRPKARYCRTCKNADDKQRRDAKKNLHTPAEQTNE